MLKVSAGILTHRHLQPRTAKDGNHQLLLYGFAVDFILDECVEDIRTLAMSNQNDAATMIVMFEIIIPGIDDIMIAQH